MLSIRKKLVIFLCGFLVLLGYASQIEARITRDSFLLQKELENAEISLKTKSEIREFFTKNLKIIRKLKGFSQRDLAVELKSKCVYSYTPTTELSNWEWKESKNNNLISHKRALELRLNKNTKLPSPRVIPVLADILEVSVYDLSCGGKEKLDELPLKITIYIARLANGMTIAELAEKIGVSSSSISYWETGENIPVPEHLTKLAKELNIKKERFRN